MVMVRSIDSSCLFAYALSPCLHSQPFPAVLQFFLLIRYFMTLQSRPLVEAQPIFGHLKRFDSMSVLEER